MSEEPAERATDVDGNFASTGASVTFLIAHVARSEVKKSNLIRAGRLPPATFWHR